MGRKGGGGGGGEEGREGVAQKQNPCRLSVVFSILTLHNIPSVNIIRCIHHSSAVANNHLLCQPLICSSQVPVVKKSIPCTHLRSAVSIRPLKKTKSIVTAVDPLYSLVRCKRCHPL